jgi:hypothetical protein
MKRVAVVNRSSLDLDEGVRGTTTMVDSHVGIVRPVLK